jgi:TonB family protein
MLPHAKSRSDPDGNELSDFGARYPEITAAHGEIIPSDFDLDEPNYGIFSGDNQDISPRRELLDANLTLPRPIRKNSMFATAPQPYQTWALVLGSLVVFAAVGLIWMIGYRIGLLRSAQNRDWQNAELVSGDSPAAASEATTVAVHRQGDSALESSGTAKGPRSMNGTPPNTRDELIIYEKGKVIFRMKPMQSAEPSAAVRRSASGNDWSSIGGNSAAGGVALTTPASESGEITSSAVWLAASEADRRLIERVEPEYPADALAAHRTGNVSLEVQVAEDGTVSSVRTLAGDPLLATAAARAVRNWRYQSYRKGGRPASFQTDVTLTFSLPK